MPTTNLGLATISPSDNISPTPINQNMERLDKLGLDYVVAQGASGIWRYRRWRSGTFECWGTYFRQSASPSQRPHVADGTVAVDKVSVNVTVDGKNGSGSGSGTGSAYVTQGFIKATANYPASFAAAPVLNVNARQSGNLACYVAYTENQVNAAEFWVGGLVANADLSCFIHAIGRVS